MTKWQKIPTKEIGHWPGLEGISEHDVSDLLNQALINSNRWVEPGQFNFKPIGKVRFIYVNANCLVDAPSAAVLYHCCYLADQCHN